MSLIEQLKKREEELLKELEEKQKRIDELKDQNFEKLQAIPHEQNAYTLFLENRVMDSQAETRRILSKYSEMRVFAY